MTCYSYYKDKNDMVPYTKLGTASTLPWCSIYSPGHIVILLLLSSTDCSGVQWRSTTDGAYGGDAHPLPPAGLPGGEGHPSHLGLSLARQEGRADPSHLEGERRQTDLREEDLEVHTVLLPLHWPPGSDKKEEVRLSVHETCNSQEWQEIISFMHKS